MGQSRGASLGGVRAPGEAHSQRGQATPEWVALLLLMALLFLAAFAKADPLSLGVSLARGLATNLLCAARLERDCGPDSPLVAAYGAELAAALRSHAPQVVYERGMRALPVDFRSCRRSACADGDEEGRLVRSRGGEPVTAFVRLVDCRVAGAPVAAGWARCGGPRAGNLYLQYWFFYPDSATLRGVPVAGSRGFHRDDWESYQVRIGPGGRADARASSHRGYNYERGRANWASDAGIGFVNEGLEAVGLRSRGGWGPETGLLFVSGGSHAGNAKASGLRYARFTPARSLRLVPLETLGAREGHRFAVSPPWRKAVWSDPEAAGTD